MSKKEVIEIIGEENLVNCAICLSELGELGD